MLRKTKAGRVHSYTFVATALTWLATGSAFAQEGGSQSGGSLLLEEITVTAQKREEDSQDVGIAITAFSGDQLDKLGVTDSTDIADFTPGVSLSGSFAGQQRQFSIRGVTQNDFNAHVESPTAIYIDDGYVASQQGQIFAAFDLERVEILKGPQGTLFGRNATGGLVHFITRKPTQEFEGYVDLTAGDYDQLEVQGAVGGPISDRVSFRVSGLYKENSGWLENLFPDQTNVPPGLSPPLASGPLGAEGGNSDFGAEETWAVRAQLLFEINDHSELNISLGASDAVQSTGPYQSAPTIAVLDDQGRTTNTLRLLPGSTETREFISPSNPAFDNFFDGDGDNTRPVPGGDFYGYIDPDGNDFTTSSDFAFDDSNFTEITAATIKYTLDFGDDKRFTSVTDAKTLDRLQNLDLEASPASQFTWTDQSESESFTQEFRLQGQTDRNQWQTGLYYLTIETTGASSLSALANGVSFAPTFVNFENPLIVDLDTTSVSAFAQNDFEWTDTLKLILGARITQEKKDYIGDQTYSPINNDILRFEDTSLLAPSARPEGTFVGSSDDTLFTAKVQLDWQLSDAVLLYTGYNRGVKAGSFNTAGFPNAEVPYDEEILNAYEIGIKSDPTDRLRFNGAVYYYGYTDYQASFWTGLSNQITNNDAEITGIEFEIISNPVDNLDLLFNVGYIDATVEGVIIAGVPRDVRPTFSPEWTVAGLARYTIPDLFGGWGFAQLSASYQSEVFHNLANFDSTEFDGWTVVDLRVGWESENGSWGVDVFAENLFDERYDIIGFDLSTVCGCNEEAQGLPRWVGASLRVNF